MRRSQRWIEGSRRVVVVLVGTIAVSCGDDVTAPPAPGTVRVTAPTTGLDAPGSYSIFVDEKPARLLSPHGTLDASLLEPGEHQIRIEVAANCTVQGEATRIVTVTSMTTTPVSFDVQCVAAWGVLNYSLSTTGPDRPLNYWLKAASSSPVYVLPTIVGSLTNIAPGSHEITLQNVPPNCNVADNPRTVEMTAGTLVRDTVDVEFNVACTALTAVVVVSVTTTGDDWDYSGYMLSLDAGLLHRNVPRTTTTFFNGVAAGQHSVAISDVASNCTVAGANPKTAQVTVGGAIQDTARITFEVSCTRVSKIAFTRWVQGYWPTVVVAHADGSNEFTLNVEGLFGAWSADGATLVIQALNCDDYYYYYGCSELGVQTVGMQNVPTLSVTWLTRTWEDESPTYSPDGKKIAFVRRDELFVMNADGTEPTAIVLRNAATGVEMARSPAWSPDGKRIAFGCDVMQTGWSEICAVDSDGANLTKLTSDPYDDGDPVWSPDGSLIAFSTNRGTTDGKMHIATMTPAGTSFVQLQPGIMPAWSGDGTKILFSVQTSPPGIFMMNADGTQVKRLTNGSDYGAKWRP